MGLFRFLSSSSPELQPKRPLHRVHLIVHPGDGLREDTLDAEAKLLRAIEARAVSLDTRDEIAVVLLQMSSAELHRFRDPAYRGKERILATALGHIEAGIPDNVIVMPDAPSVAYPCLERTFNGIQEKIAALGFILGEETELLSYGEMVTKCVPRGARYFARHFGLKQPPIIDVNYTDALISDSPAQWRRNGIRLSVAETLNGNGVRYIPMKDRKSRNG